MGTDMQRNYPVVKKTVPTLYFIGVTTTKSSIVKVFPLWMEVLGRPEIVLEGVDCKIHDEPGSLPAGRCPDQVRSAVNWSAGNNPQNRSADRGARHVRLPGPLCADHR
jgi:hypothetical protein